jgi:hypothetical protein
VYVVKDNEELYGAWVNEEYIHDGGHPLQKLVFNPDGTFEDYAKITDTSPHHPATYEIKEKWTDSNHNIWYKFTIYFVLDSTTQYVLSKINNSATIIEFSMYAGGYPTEIDPNSYLGTYRIYYRQ